MTSCLSKIRNFHAKQSTNFGVSFMTDLFAVLEKQLANNVTVGS